MPQKPLDVHGEEVGEAIRWFFRAIRTLRTYPEDNEISRRALAELLPRLSAVLPLSLEIGAEQLSSEDRALLDDSGKTPLLVAELHRDGLRRLRLDVGLEEDELRRLLRVLASRLDPNEVSEDYVTRLWEAELSHVRMSAVDPYLNPNIGEGEDVLEGREKPTELAREAEEDHQPDAPPAPEFAFRIGKEEETRVCEEVEQMAATKRWEEFASATFDVLDTGLAEQTHAELVAILEACFYELLKERQVATAARLVEHLKRRSSGPAAALFGPMASRMAQVDRLAGLHEALEGGTSNPQDALSILVLLGPDSVSAVCAFLDKAGAEWSRRVYLDALSRIGNAAVEAVLQRFRKSSGEIRCRYARALAGLQGRAVVSALVAALSDPDQAVRREVIRALSRQDDGRALAALLRISIEDGEEASRLIALRALAGARSRLDCESLIQRIGSRQYRALSSEEKDLLFRGLGAIGDDRTMPLFRGIIRPRWIPWLERRHDWPRAAAALVHIGTPAAHETLQAFSQHRRSELASICANALRTWRQEQA
jgi:hypothetical protein